MAKDKGQVRRVLQILSLEDQETLAILHNPPLMEELLRRQETIAEARAAGLRGGMADALPGIELPLQVFPTVLDEWSRLDAGVQQALTQTYLPSLVAAPQEGLALTQLFQGLWISVCPVDGLDYRIVYECLSPATAITVLMIGTWASLEERLEDD